MERYLCDTCLYALLLSTKTTVSEGATGCSAYINTYGVSVDRIGEICEAERDGRVVILPTLDTGIIRRMDDLGRVVIPKIVRSKLGLCADNYPPVMIIGCEDGIFLREYRAEAEAALAQEGGQDDEQA